MSEVDALLTHQVIENQIRQWQLSMEDLRIAAIVSQSIGDKEERITQLRDEMKRCVKAIEKLQAMLTELPTNDEQTP